MPQKRKQLESFIVDAESDVSDEMAMDDRLCTGVKPKTTSFEVDDIEIRCVLRRSLQPPRA